MESRLIPTLRCEDLRCSGSDVESLSSESLLCKRCDRVDDRTDGGVRREGSWDSELRRTDRSVALLPIEGLASGEDTLVLWVGEGNSRRGLK